MNDTTMLLSADEAWEQNGNTDRRRIVRGLRLLGFSYGEIRDLVPVSKSTVSVWCRDIDLTTDQQRAIARRSGPESRLGTRVDTQWRRRLEIEAIRNDASGYSLDAVDDPLFVAGVCLYWAEGSKTRNDLSMSNSDPSLLRVFIQFVRDHLDDNATFALALTRHSAAGEEEARRFWSTSLGLDDVRFTKSYIKKPGTGHRRKKLPHGVCRVRVDRGSDHWHRMMQWIDDLRVLLAS
ncbi:MAG: hypothetical protein QNJ71_09850 [Acidimicrobiia bacterium]|nr:hypothetical protein [Acidimicrobiia bacterium]